MVLGKNLNWQESSSWRTKLREKMRRKTSCHNNNYPTLGNIVKKHTVLGQEWWVITGFNMMGIAEHLRKEYKLIIVGHKMRQLVSRRRQQVVADGSKPQSNQTTIGCTKYMQWIHSQIIHRTLLVNINLSIQIYFLTAAASKRLHQLTVEHMLIPQATLQMLFKILFQPNLRLEHNQNTKELSSKKVVKLLINLSLHKNLHHLRKMYHF